MTMTMALPENGESSSPERPAAAAEASLRQFPKTVWLIVGNEFCERFSFYGMRAILALYFTNQLLLTETQATTAVHLFIMASYISPLFGAIISDSYLGKYRTIMILSLVYCLGNWTLSFSALDWSIDLTRAITVLGLFFIAVGTGGIKPCVSAFGGDQIEFSFKPSPARDDLLRLFFSAFYFAINIGATLSTIITPWTRTAFHSYSLAFALPAGLMVVATSIFWTGQSSYVHQVPAGNLLQRVVGIVMEAFMKRSKSDVSLGVSGVTANSELDISTVPEGSSETVPLQPGIPKRGSKRQILAPGEVKPSHWLDGAKRKYGDEAVEDVKLLLQVLTLFIPVPIFWSLFDQQASRWVFQAKRMNGKVLWFTIEPDQMQTANSLLILIMIPLFDQIIYPQLAKRGVSLRPIRRMVAGMALAVFAFIISGLLQVWMDSVAESGNSSPSPLPSPSPSLSISPGGALNLGGVMSYSKLAAFTGNGSWADNRYSYGHTLTGGTETPMGDCSVEGQKCISILWQFPQYVVMTAGEILFSITGLELAYSQAPSSMTSVVSSFWSLTVAFGNLFTVLVVGSIGPLLTQAQEFFFFSGGCALALLLLIFVGRGFTYIESAEISDDVEGGRGGRPSFLQEEEHALSIERS